MAATVLRAVSLAFLGCAGVAAQTPAPVFEPAQVTVQAQVRTQALPPFAGEITTVEPFTATVEVGFVIASDGTVVAPAVTNSTPETKPFVDAIVAAIGRWRFLPAKKDGAAVAVRASVAMTIAVRAIGPPTARKRVAGVTATVHGASDQFELATNPGSAEGRKIVTQPSPGYTDSGMRQKIQGTVQVEAVLQSDGTIGATRILKSLDGPSGLDYEALQAAQRWLFDPSPQGASSLPQVVTITFDFKLN